MTTLTCLNRLSISASEFSFAVEQAEVAIRRLAYHWEQWIQDKVARLSRDEASWYHTLVAADHFPMDALETIRLLRYL